MKLRLPRLDAIETIPLVEEPTEELRKENGLFYHACKNALDSHGDQIRFVKVKIKHLDRDVFLPLVQEVYSVYSEMANDALEVEKNTKPSIKNQKEKEFEKKLRKKSKELVSSYKELVKVAFVGFDGIELEDDKGNSIKLEDLSPEQRVRHLSNAGILELVGLSVARINTLSSDNKKK